MPGPLTTSWPAAIKGGRYTRTSATGSCGWKRWAKRVRRPVGAFRGVGVLVVPAHHGAAAVGERAVGDGRRIQSDAGHWPGEASGAAGTGAAQKAIAAGVLEQSERGGGMNVFLIPGPKENWKRQLFYLLTPALMGDPFMAAACWSWGSRRPVSDDRPSFYTSSSAIRFWFGCPLWSVISSTRPACVQT